MSGRLLGRLLRGFHAGEKHLAWNDVAAAGRTTTITLTSSAFPAGGRIPLRHAGKGVGDNISPALAWSGVPRDAKELVIVVEDPDAPLPRPFVHAIGFAIPPSATSLAEGSLSSPAPDGPSLGKSTFGKTGYGGPRPIRGHGPHAYVFQIFALDRTLSFSSAPSLRELLRQMRGSVIARGRLDGIYER